LSAEDNRPCASFLQVSASLGSDDRANVVARAYPSQVSSLCDGSFAGTVEPHQQRRGLRLRRIFVAALHHYKCISSRYTVQKKTTITGTARRGIGQGRDRGGTNRRCARDPRPTAFVVTSAGRFFGVQLCITGPMGLFFASPVASRNRSGVCGAELCRREAAGRSTGCRRFPYPWSPRPCVARARAAGHDPSPASHRQTNHIARRD